MDTTAVVYMLELIQSVTDLHSSTSDALSSEFLQGLYPLNLADDLLRCLYSSLQAVAQLETCHTVHYASCYVTADGTVEPFMLQHGFS